jgi:hypothetical protein
MKNLLVLLVLGVIAWTSRGGEVSRLGPGDDPVLLASGKGYTLHLFRGAVTGQPGLEMVATPGVAIFHTDRSSGKASWLLRTGVYGQPTRRQTYAVTRLVGLYQTDAQLAVVLFEANGRVFESPAALRTADGGYWLEVFDKASGKRAFRTPLAVPENAPREVPEETAELGLIQPTDEGFTVLGTLWTVQGKGGIAAKKADPPPTGQKVPPSRPTKVQF